MKALGWVWFVVVQLIMLAATVAGLVLLAPFCLCGAWRISAESIKDGRPVDVWSWAPLNYVYGNPEDGVSGQTALVWLNGETQAPYMPNARAAWRAYCWSALRNSADNLKYVFAWENGPSAQIAVRGRTIKLGWFLENGHKVPVL